SEARPETDAERRASEILIHFEDLLAANPDRNLRLADVCDRLGVSDLSFREIYLACLGVGALKYMQLRRPNLVRAAILPAREARVADFARHAGSPNTAGPRHTTRLRSAKRPPRLSGV